MPDSEQKRGKADRSKVAKGEPYEVYFFARKHGITPDQARRLIAKIGNNHDKLNKAAEKLRQRGS